MSRIKQTQSIDKLIQAIKDVIKNRYSLSDEDVKIFNDALTRLLHLKKKKGKTNEQILNETVEIVCLLAKVFKDED